MTPLAWAFHGNAWMTMEMAEQKLGCRVEAATPAATPAEQSCTMANGWLCVVYACITSSGLDLWIAKSVRIWPWQLGTRPPQQRLGGIYIPHGAKIKYRCVRTGMQVEAA